jgi:PAS domain S-box-containing protein
MEEHPVRVVLIEDNPGDIRLVIEMLTGPEMFYPFKVESAETFAQASEILSQERFDVIILDLALPDEYGLETLSRISKIAPGVPIVILSGTRDRELAVEAVQKGAQDYLVKGNMNSELLVRSLRYAIERKKADIDRRLKDSAIADSINPIAMTDLEGKLTYANKAFLNCWGYGKQREVLGRHAEEFWGIDRSSGRMIEGMIYTGNWSGELNAIRQNGSRFEILLSATIAKNEAGYPLCMMASFLDISLKKQSEDALKKSEKRYRLLAENATDVIWITDLEMKSTYISPSIYQMCGYTAKEVKEEIGEELLTPASYNLFTKIIKEELEKEKAGQLDMFGSRTFELELFCKDGSTVWNEIKMSFIYDDDHKPVGFLGVARVITERKRAMEQTESVNMISQLFLSSETLESTYRELPGIISDRFGFPVVSVELFDETSREMAVTGSVGIPFDESWPVRMEIGKTLGGIVAETDQAIFELDAGRHSEQMFSMAKKLKIKTIIGAPMRIKGRLLGAVCLADKKKRPEAKSLAKVIQVIANHLAQEIERKSAERQLASEKEQLAVTLRSIVDGVITTDTDGNILLMNQVAETITGQSQQESIGRPFSEVFGVIAVKSKKIRPDIIRKVVEKNRSITARGDICVRTPDGPELTLSMKASPMRNKGNSIVGVIIVFSDITYQRQVEEERQRTQRLESTALLAGGVAHDFNSFLTAFMANITLAKIYTSSEDKVFKILNEAEKAASQARDLTCQLLTFSMGEGVSKKTSSIGELIRDSAIFSLRGSKTRCAFAIPHNLWPVSIDSGMMGQVINNLIINADQAMPRGGTINVQARNVETRHKIVLHGVLLKPGNYIEIAIEDHGVGVTRKNIERIFDPYFTTKEEGSGLGLATSYFIMKNHNGHISVESEIGVGTVFYLYLPAIPKAHPTRRIETPKPVKGEGKILLMDDEQIIRAATSELLRHLGYEVKCTAEGGEAIMEYQEAMSENRPFDAVIMDLTIAGGMGGIETIDQLKKIDPHVSAIVSSGYTTNEAMTDFESFGFRGVIFKPYKIRELSETLQKVLAAARV